MNEIQEMQSKKTRFESDIAALTKSAELFTDQTEEKGDITLIVRSNSLQRRKRHYAKSNSCIVVHCRKETLRLLQ